MRERSMSSTNCCRNMQLSDFFLPSAPDMCMSYCDRCHTSVIGRSNLCFAAATASAVCIICASDDAVSCDVDISIAVIVCDRTGIASTVSDGSRQRF